MMLRKMANGEACYRIWAKYYQFSSLVFLVYDVLLTLSSEMRVIWKRKFSAVTVLWALVRSNVTVVVFRSLITTYRIAGCFSHLSSQMSYVSSL